MLHENKHAVLTLPNKIQEVIKHGNALLKSEKFEEADAVFLYAKQKWPDSPLPYIGSARTAHFGSNNHNLSLERWTIAREKFPADLQVLKGLGSLYLEMKEFDKASECFTEVHHLEADSFRELNAFMQGVNVLMTSEEYSKAEELLHEAQTRWPEKCSPFYTHHRLLEVHRRSLK